MSPTSKPKAITYGEAVRTLNTDDVQADLDGACEQLALSVVGFTAKFDVVAQLLQNAVLQEPTITLRAQWNTLNKDFKDLLWHFRSNAGFISGRLKMFCSVVLPLAARNSSGARSHDEKLQVLQSYMTISAEHAALTRALVANASKFNNVLNSFHIDFLKLTSQRTASGQRELRDLSQKLSELEGCTRQYNGKYSGSDVTHLVYSTLRLSASCKRKSRPRFSHQRLALLGDLAVIGRFYEQLEGTQNSVTHAQYTAQVCHRRTHGLTTAQTTISSLVSEEMIVMESGLSFFLSIWSRLQYDCNDILNWLQHPRGHPIPHAIASLLDGGDNLYAAVAHSLDICVAGIDPSHFASK
ncbi:hypothetical protein L208DRAFT_1338840 [Tricholoma matsutake]|nr:hypothetical protein L208DRAFT_1338840 [Tricholoma matsutake 945]